MTEQERLRDHKEARKSLGGGAGGGGGGGGRSEGKGSGGVGRSSQTCLF